MHAWHWTCLTFQSAVLTAQSSLAEEEEEEKHAGHLRFPQEPQPNFVQSGAGVWGRGLRRRGSHCCYSTHRVRVCTGTTHTQEDVTLVRRQNAQYALYYNTPHHKGLTHSPPIFCSTVSHFLLLISSWFLYGQSAPLSSINTLTNITLNLPHFFVDTRNGW